MKDLQTQTETRCQQILDEAASLKLELKGRFKIEMLKLPKMIREMPLVQFQEEYGEDLLTVSKEAAEEAIKSRGRELEEPKTAVKGSGRGGRTNNSSQQQDMPPPVPALMTVHAVDAGAMPMQTPMRGNRGPMVPMTPSTVRLARQGEMLVSANGSPILQQASIAAVTEKEGAQIAVELPDIGLVNVETDMVRYWRGSKRKSKYKCKVRQYLALQSHEHTAISAVQIVHASNCDLEALYSSPELIGMTCMPVRLMLFAIYIYCCGLLYSTVFIPFSLLCCHFLVPG
ncbi:unnamed protein product [Chrysoparadoxa australica]